MSQDITQLIDFLKENMTSDTAVTNSLLDLMNLIKNTPSIDLTQILQRLSAVESQLGVLNNEVININAQMATIQVQLNQILPRLTQVENKINAAQNLLDAFVFGEANSTINPLYLKPKYFVATG